MILPNCFRVKKDEIYTNAGAGYPIEFHTALRFNTFPFQIEIVSEMVPLSLKMYKTKKPTPFSCLRAKSKTEEYPLCSWCYAWSFCQGFRVSFCSVRNKMADVHFTTIPCEPNKANRQKSHMLFFLRNLSL